MTEKIFSEIIQPKKGLEYGFRAEILQCYGSLLYLCKPAKKGDDYKGLDRHDLMDYYDRNVTKAQLDIMCRGFQTCYDCAGIRIIPGLMLSGFIWQ